MSTSPLRNDSRLRTLVLFAHYGNRASYYDDWADALRQAPELAVDELNICASGARGELRRRLNGVDLVVLLHSVNADQVFYLEPLAPLLAQRSCRLLSFVGNEVNLPGAPIADKRRVLAAIRPDWIATQLLQEAGDHLWGDLATVVSIPHALNPQAFRPQTPVAQRPLDVGVRSFRYPAVLGDLDRNRVMDWMAKAGPAAGLQVDIGSGRLDRAAWAAYLDRCRATVATEAGSWYLQRDDALVNAALSHYRAGSGLVVSARLTWLRRMVHRLPWSARQRLMSWLSRGPVRYESTSLAQVPDEDVIERFFACQPRASAYTKCISSRHFDAVGTGTAQVLLQGRYNDILVPDEDYLSLAPDLSNGPEVLERLRDTDLLVRMTRRALDRVMAHHTYPHRIQHMVRIVAG